MNEVQDWAVGLCTAGIGCTLLHTLCPAGTMRRVFKVLTGVFFFCCLMSPLSALTELATDLFALPAHTAVPSALSETVDEQIQDLLDQALLQDAQARLGDAVTVKDVSVKRDMSRTDSIYIECVRITLAQEDHALSHTVYPMLEQAWGIKVEVYYDG